MKKAIAIFLIVGLLLSFGAFEGTKQSASVALEQMDIKTVSSNGDEGHQEAAVSIVNKASQDLDGSLKNIERENGLVTIEYLENLSWEDIRDNYTNLFINSDDLYLYHVIMNIDRDDSFDIKNGYILSRNGMVYLEKTTYDVICQKLQIIIDKYNVANDIQIKLYTKQYTDDPGHMNITLLSSNYPATYVGQTVQLKRGALFYESSKHFGSGNYSTTFYIDCVGYGFEQFSYIPNDYMVLVNGISYLDDDGNIISATYMTFDEIMAQNMHISIDFSKTYMLHICTSQTDLGWLVPEDVKSVD